MTPCHAAGLVVFLWATTDLSWHVVLMLVWTLWGSDGR